MKLLTKLLLGPMARVGRPYLESVGLLQTNSLFATSTLVWEPARARVLVFAPHMDDETIGCGGTLARHVAAGSRVSVVFFTDGRYGDPALAELSGEARRERELELIAGRKQEAEHALSILGVQEHRFLDERDGSLASHAALVARVRQLIEEFQPEYVYLPFFLDHHPDHRAVTRILLDATAGTQIDFICVAYEVWAPLWPNTLVRIDGELDTKRRALLEYRSQVAHCDYVHHSLGLNAYRAAPLDDATTRHAEAFCMLPLRKYAELAGSVAKRAGS